MPYSDLSSETLAELKDSGVGTILLEKLRQVEVEGFVPEHDAEHTDDSLVLAALHYAAPESVYLLVYRGLQTRPIFEDVWPKSWARKWDKKKKHDRIKQLAIAGALIASEIDRLNAERNSAIIDGLDFYEEDKGKPPPEFNLRPPAALTTDHFMNTFGEREMELAARVIVRMAVHAGAWAITFSQEDFLHLPDDRAGYTKDGFEDLIAHRWLLRSGQANGMKLYRVCYEFVSRLVKRRPQAFQS